MSKQEIPSKIRIITISSCGGCPHHTVEETEKNEYRFCWAIMESIKDIDSIHEKCPLEEVDFEWEDEYDDD